MLDDLNLALGAQRLRAKGNDGGHNGLKSINQLIGSNYARLRIGISRNFSQGHQSNYVLGKWSDEEAEKLPEILRFAADAVKSFGTIGVTHTMNKYNRK